MSHENNCVFCNNKCKLRGTPNHHLLDTYYCDYCGEYILAKPESASFHKRNPSDKFKIACILNERRLKGSGGIAICEKMETGKEIKVCGYPLVSVDDILDEFPKKANDFLNRTLLNLSRLGERPFEIIKLDIANNKDCLHLFMPNTEGSKAFLQELAEQNYIRFNQVRDGIQWHVFFLTTKFWEVVENLQKTEVDNKRAFVAIWFDKSMDDYYKYGIKKAIEDAGYIPVRIDLQDFNNKICDEIIAEIKRTKFLIADFSGLRSGVFFEAGFAKGLGREVIFTVRQEDVAKLKEHFDTRQYNHIVYDSSKDLRKKLYNRIGATIV